MEEKILNKAQMYRLFQAGKFGNRTRVFKDLEDALKSDFSGLFSVRLRQREYRHLGYYHLPKSQLSETVAKIKSHGIGTRGMVICESAPDDLLLINGELLYKAPEGLCLYYNDMDKTAMVPALASPNAKQAYGLTALCLLRKYLDPAGLEWMLDMVERFEDAVIEFSAFSCFVGEIPRRNTIVWEVRNY